MRLHLALARQCYYGVADTGFELKLASMELGQIDRAFAGAHGWLTGSRTICGLAAGHTPEKYKPAPNATISIAAISSGRRVVVGCIVVTLIVVFPSLFAVKSVNVDGLTLVDQPAEDIHRNMYWRVYCLAVEGSAGV